MLATEDDDIPVNAIHAFVKIARGGSERAARALGATRVQQRPLRGCVLQDYSGADLMERRYTWSELKEFGGFCDAVAEPLDTVSFTASEMRGRKHPEANRIVVGTLISNFAYSRRTAFSTLWQEPLSCSLRPVSEY